MITHSRVLAVVQTERTSEREYEVDAWAHLTEEGRGERRNVRGELHTSEEPRESE